MIGIYKITNPENKVYIGYTTNLYKRKNYYKVNKGIRQTKLYNSITQYSWEQHKIELIEECVKDELRDKGFLNVDLFFEAPTKIDKSKQENAYHSIYGRGWEDYDFVSYVKKIDSYPNEYFDVLVIDGRARPFCLKHGLNKVKPGGYIVYDNLEREYYKDDLFNSILSWKVHDRYGAVIGDRSFTSTFILKKPI
jgi:predicted GIY-YIG superfamily endonuclease